MWRLPFLLFCKRLHISLLEWYGGGAVPPMIARRYSALAVPLKQVCSKRPRCTPQASLLQAPPLYQSSLYNKVK